MSCGAPLSLEALLAYRQGELDDAAAGEVEEHYFACAACAAALAWLEGLGAAVAGLVGVGAVSAAVTGALVERAAAQGLRVRTYRLAPGGRVACTAAPEDDLVALRLAVDAPEGEGVDLVAEVVDAASGARFTRRTDDVVVDRVAGEAVLVHAGAQIRAFPRTRWELELRTRGPAPRALGAYTLEHTPWEELPGTA
ncbi:MAG: hypothetical protein KF878_14840 [Planctomycetes bacterium]|nr:hypothetical protein [Planctomycetota bacterium]